jgi:hypothetical protein
LVGGGGSQPQRWYLAVNADVRLGGGSTLLRSDDDGATWTDVLEYRSGSTSDTSPGTGDLWNVRIEGLAYDPSHPDTIYVARTATPLTAAWWSPSRVITSGVAVTTDAGLTWNDLGSQEVGRIDDLAISNQGTRLFLAANHSLFTLDLGS